MSKLRVTGSKTEVVELESGLARITEPTYEITPDAPKAVAEKPAPDESPAPAGKQPPRPRRVAPTPEN